jgi:hypothetical protein
MQERSSNSNPVECRERGLHQSKQSVSEKAHKPALKSLVASNSNEIIGFFSSYRSAVMATVHIDVGVLP